LARHLREAGMLIVEVDRPDRRARRAHGKSDLLAPIRLPGLRCLVLPRSCRSYATAGSRRSGRFASRELVPVPSLGSVPLFLPLSPKIGRSEIPRAGALRWPMPPIKPAPIMSRAAGKGHGSRLTRLALAIISPRQPWQPRASALHHGAVHLPSLCLRGKSRKQ
jgi:hypothetical protein